MRWLVALCFTSLVLPSAAAIACGKDTDCKGTRICDQGQCVWPAQAPTTAATERVPAAPATPAAPDKAVAPEKVPAPVPEKTDRYVLAGDKVVDHQTNLTWQRAVPAQSYGWEDAKGYCASLRVSELSNWRLPTKGELESIVDKTAHPTIDPAAFPGTPDEGFWTSSAAENSAWAVHFGNGTGVDQPTGLPFHVRCVLSPEVKQPVTPSYVVGSETVLDQRTNLTWQREISPTTTSWNTAKAYCTSLELGGFTSGWRLPTKGELWSLVVRSSHPTIDSAAFPQTPAEWFWTSSTTSTDGKDAWLFVNFGDGTYGSGTSGPTRVRCVR